MDGYAHGNICPSDPARTGFGSSDGYDHSNTHDSARAAARDTGAAYRAPYHRPARRARGNVNRHQPAWPHRHGDAHPGYHIVPNTCRNRRSDDNSSAQPHTEATADPATKFGPLTRPSPRQGRRSRPGQVARRDHRSRHGQVARPGRRSPRGRNRRYSPARHESRHRFRP